MYLHLDVGEVCPSDWCWILMVSDFPVVSKYKNTLSKCY